MVIPRKDPVHISLGTFSNFAVYNIIKTSGLYMFAVFQNHFISVKKKKMPCIYEDNEWSVYFSTWPFKIGNTYYLEHACVWIFINLCILCLIKFSTIILNDPYIESLLYVLTNVHSSTSYYLSVAQCKTGKLSTLVRYLNLSLALSHRYKTQHIDARFEPHQWETAPHCNGVSHWLGASLESALLKPGHDGRHCREDILRCFFLKVTVSWSIQIALKFVPEGSMKNWTVSKLSQTFQFPALERKDGLGRHGLNVWRLMSKRVAWLALTH